MMRTYSDATAYLKMNEKNFSLVQQASANLLSQDEIGMSGDAINKAESLSYEFLKLANIATDLMLGLASSVNKAKSKVKTTTGLLFREMEGSAASKKELIPSTQGWVEATNTEAELSDLKDYIEGKKEDFMANHYYYKQLAQGKYS